MSMVEMHRKKHGRQMRLSQNKGKTGYPILETPDMRLLEEVKGVR